MKDEYSGTCRLKKVHGGESLAFHHTVLRCMAVLIHKRWTAVQCAKVIESILHLERRGRGGARTALQYFIDTYHVMYLFDKKSRREHLVVSEHFPGILIARFPKILVGAMFLF